MEVMANNLAVPSARELSYDALWVNTADAATSQGTIRARPL